MKKIYLVVFLFFVSNLLHAKTIYVAATGNNLDGQSWSTAFNGFQSGINAAVSGDQVWVAKGSYTPTLGTSFTMAPGVEIYGGFAGNETIIGQRNVVTNVTFLTVVGQTVSIISNNNNGLTSSAIIDGFTFRRGQAVIGAGMYNNNVSPTITNCIFSENISIQGGGMYNSNSNPTVTKCDFIGNIIGSNTLGQGGGMYNINSNPIITNCRFVGNSATSNTSGGNGGGGMFNTASSPKILNSLFFGNTTQNGNGIICYGGGVYITGGASIIANCTFAGNVGFGGGLYIESGTFCTLSNSIIWGNSNGIVYGSTFSINTTIANSIVQKDGSYQFSSLPGTTNLTSDPLFVNPTSYTTAPFTSGDYKLQSTSPAINSGDNSLYTTVGGNINTDADLAGNARLYNNVIDRGSYEYGSTILPVIWIAINAKLNNKNLAEINWQVEEQNVFAYKIETSEDGISFKENGTLNSVGNGLHNYIYTDINPLAKTTFFRVKQIDRDGALTYSSILQLAVEQKQPIYIYPNPVKDVFVVKNYNNNLLNTKASLLDVHGKTLQKISINSPSFSVQMLNYPAGIYLLQFANGEIQKITKE